MLGWKFAFNNISLIFLDNNNKSNENLFIPKKLQEYINFPDVLLYFFLPLGYKIGELFDFSICLFISLFIQIISIGMIIIFFVTDYTLFILVSFGLFNIGNTLSCLMLVQNCCKFYLKKVGLIYSIYLSGSSFGSFIFTIFGKFVIKKVGSSFINKIFLFVSGFITFLCGLFVMGLTSKHKDILKSKDSNSTSSSNENTSDKLDDITSDYNLSRQRSFSSLILYKINIKKVIFSKINLQLIYFLICDFCKYISFIY